MDKTSDLAGPGIGNYTDLERILPNGYRPLLTPRETQIALFALKDYLEENLCKELNLIRVTVPLIVDVESGVNDTLDRDGSRTPIQFHIANDHDENPLDAQIVQAATKWKRMALKQFDMKPGEGLLTDMRAVRKDYFLDHDHSAYVDQWDWELAITSEQRTLNFLKTVVEKIWKVIKNSEIYIKGLFPQLRSDSHPDLPEELTFIHAEDILDRYPECLNSDDDSGAGRAATVAEAPAQPEASQPEPKKAPEPAPVAAQPVEIQPAATPEPETPVAQPVANAKSRNAKKKVAAPAPIIPGQLAIDSTPQGAQVQVDGRTDPSYVTPFALTNLQPGQHSITVSKPGYSTDTRTVAVTSGNRATAVVHLAQLMATLVVKSDPPGANIYVDGRDMGTKTPAQVSVDKGQHVVLVRMSGYIDETMNAQFVLGQTFNFSPTLRSLGNTDNIKTVGKMSKLFGGKGGQPGQATVSIHTQPKGAQIAINQHMLEKGSPVDVLLDPGNYVIDITLSGYAPVRKVITADKGGKVLVDEVLQPQ